MPRYVEPILPQHTRLVRGPALDRFAILLSGLCVVHCLATATFLAVVSAAGGLLTESWVHEAGLALAILLGAVALGRGLFHHGRLLPLGIGAAGLALMAGGLMVPHGWAETVWTVLGVSVLAAGHYLNRRFAA